MSASTTSAGLKSLVELRVEEAHRHDLGNRKNDTELANKILDGLPGGAVLQ